MLLGHFFHHLFAKLLLPESFCRKMTFWGWAQPPKILKEGRQKEFDHFQTPFAATWCWWRRRLGCTPSLRESYDNTTSKKGSSKGSRGCFWEGSKKGSYKGLAVGIRRRELRRVLRRGSKNGLSRRRLKGRNTPFQEYDPLCARAVEVGGGGNKNRGGV